MIEFKDKNIKYLLVLIVIVCMVFLSYGSWYFLVKKDEFKVTILNLSGQELFVYVVLQNKSAIDYFDWEVTTNGLESNESRSFTFTPPCKKFYFTVRTADDNLNTINWTYYTFQGDEFYNLMVIVQNSGENITITRMPPL